MKFNFECSEQETLAFLESAGRTAAATVKGLSAIANVLSVNFVHVDDEDDIGPEESRPATVHPFRVVEADPGAAHAAEPQAAVKSPEEIKHDKTLALGEKKFTDFIAAWLVGINFQTMELIDGVQQPNRELLLRDLCNSPYAFPVLTYVQSKGGLQQAIFAVTNDKALARRLPDFIVPPASIVFSDLADTYEYVNPWKDEE